MLKRVIWIVVLVVLVPLGGFACGVGLLRLVQTLSETPPLREGDFRTVTAAVGSPVVLLSTRTCPWCEKTRVWLDAQDVEYRDCVVDEDAFAAELLDSVGGDSVPQLLNAGHAVSGYDPELFAQIVQDAPPQDGGLKRCHAPRVDLGVSTARPAGTSSM